MKTFVAMTVLTLVSLVLFVFSDHWRFRESDYISKEVLDRAVPVNVTIDVEFLKEFNPAYAKRK
jgi:hypothetical protein